ISEVRNGLLYNPVSLVVVVALWFGLIAFADCRHWRYRILFGGLHGLIQLWVLTAVIWGAARFLAPLDLPFLTFGLFRFTWDISCFFLAYVTVVLLVGGSAGAVVYCGYLFLMQRLGNRHATHAYSAHRCEDYRSFLRMKLDADGALTVFPVG